MAERVALNAGTGRPSGVSSSPAAAAARTSVAVQSRALNAWAIADRWSGEYVGALRLTGGILHSGLTTVYTVRTIVVRNQSTRESTIIRRLTADGRADPTITAQWPSGAE